MTPVAARTRTADSPTLGHGDIAILTGPDAGAFLGAGVGAAGGTLLRWRPRQVQSTRHGATASYATKVRWADGSVREETLAACTGDLPDRAVVLDCGDARVAVWRFPHDPDLPGLSAAADEAAVASLLDDLGLGSRAPRLVVRAYRPRRRAVIEAVGRSGRLFIKAVRPDRVQQLHERHRQLVAAGVPAPHSLGWTSDGLLVLQAIPGRTLREALRTHRGPLPTADEITAVLDRLPHQLVDAPPRPSWLDRVGHYAAAVGAVLPGEAERAIAMARAISAEAGTGPTVPIHGDLYESQLLIDNGRICGLLDIDTARAGDRLDDLGCLIGHLSVLARLEPRLAPWTNRLGARYLAAFDRTVDPADLRYRAAAVTLSLATGPHRVQQPRWPGTTRGLVNLAEQWLASARTVRRRAR
jgi:aminoglycoside phosphotransferase